MVNFYNPYMTQGNYLTELQNMRERIDNQIQQAQQQMPQIPQPTNLTQNFQLAPNNNTSNFKLVNSLDEVQKEIVLTDTYFLAKDNTQLWIKSSKGDIRTFTVNEIIPKDEKDILIENLQKEIDRLKGDGINANREYSKSNDEQLYEQSNAEYSGTVGNTIKTNESERIPTVSTSKTTKRRP